MFPHAAESEVFPFPQLREGLRQKRKKEKKKKTKNKNHQEQSFPLGSRLFKKGSSPCVQETKQKREVALTEASLS